MNILLFILVMGVVGMIIGEMMFLILKYFLMKEHSHYKIEVENLVKQLESGTISKSLYRQMQQNLEKEYHVARYNKLGTWGHKK